LQFTVDTCLEAIADAGLQPGDVDGVCAMGGAAEPSTLPKDEEQPPVVAGSRQVHAFNRVRAAVLFVAASSLLAVVAAWNGRPAYGWATMVEALDRSVWVRAEASDGSAKVSGWGSAANGIVAVQSDDMVEFVDSRRGSRSAFRRDQSKLYELTGVEGPTWQWENEVVRLLLGIESLSDPDAPPTLEDLRAFCEGQLAHYKIPSRLRILDSFPMTVSGKVRKIELRQRYAAE